MPAKAASPSTGDLDRIGLARPALRALAGAGITRITQFARFSEAEILALHGMGPNAMAKIREALRGAGIEFAKSRQQRRGGA